MCLLSVRLAQQRLMVGIKWEELVKLEIIVRWRTIACIFLPDIQVRLSWEVSSSSSSTPSLPVSLSLLSSFP